MDRFAERAGALESFAETFGFAIDRDHARSLFRKTNRGRATIAPPGADASRAGDDRDLAIEALHARAPKR